MVQTHQVNLEEGTTMPIPPQETENICHGSLDPQKVLQLHHQEDRWYGNFWASDRKALQRVVHTAKFPATQDLYTSWSHCQRLQTL